MTHRYGERIAFVSDRANIGKSSAIYQMPPASEGEIVAITDPSNEQQVFKVSWSPDGRLIAFLSAHELNNSERSETTSKDDAYVYHAQ